MREMLAYDTEATELERVQSWRAHELIRAGLPSEQALELGERLDIDLHEAVVLLERGCPADLAVRILS
jgi:hypothetical protein